MKVFKKAGCGCLYLDANNATGEVLQIVVEPCCSDPDDVDFYFAGPCNRILPEKMTDDYVSYEEHMRVFNRINQLLLAGNKFETVQRLLGIPKEAR